MIKNVSVKLFNFSNGGCIGDQERVCLTLQFLQWREYLWSRTCLSNSSASLMEGVLVIKNVSVKLFSFFNGGYIRWPRTCLSNSSASSMEGVLVIKNVSVPNPSFSPMEGALVIKNVSVKVVSFFNGRYIRDQERVCQPLQLPQWRVYWWSRTCLSKSSASLMEGIFVIKNVSVKLFSSSMESVLVIKNVSVKLSSFFHGECIGVQERVCQILQLLPWRVYWWSRTCLSNSSVSSVERLFVIKNVSVKLFSFINGRSIGDQERVCQILQLL